MSGAMKHSLNANGLTTNAGHQLDGLLSGLVASLDFDAAGSVERLVNSL